MAKKMEEGQVADALRMLSLGMSQASIAEFYGVSRQYINHLYQTRINGKQRNAYVKTRSPKTPQQHRRRVDCIVLVHKAIKAGVLVPQPCEVCGITGKGTDGKNIVHAHHDDYNKPLDVRWLCKEHHKEWHAHNSPIDID